MVVHYGAAHGRVLDFVPEEVRARLEELGVRKKGRAAAQAVQIEQWRARRGGSGVKNNKNHSIATGKKAPNFLQFIKASSSIKSFLFNNSVICCARRFCLEFSK